MRRMIEVPLDIDKLRISRKALVHSRIINHIHGALLKYLDRATKSRRDRNGEHTKAQKRYTETAVSIGMVRLVSVLTVAARSLRHTLVHGIVIHL